MSIALFFVWIWLSLVRKTKNQIKDSNSSTIHRHKPQYTVLRTYKHSESIKHKLTIIKFSTKQIKKEYRRIYHFNWFSVRCLGWYHVIIETTDACYCTVTVADLTSVFSQFSCLCSMWCYIFNLCPTCFVRDYLAVLLVTWPLYCCATLMAECEPGYK